MGGLLQPLKIPEGKWESISMDFIVGLPNTQKDHDAIWVVVDKFTKLAHFIPMRMHMNMQQLVNLYVENIAKLHGTPLSIISDREPRFTSRILREF